MPALAVARRAVITLPEVARATEIVWDGDDHADDSFTSLIPELARLRPALKLTACVRGRTAAEVAEGEGPRTPAQLESFTESWAKVRVKPHAIREVAPPAVAGGWAACANENEELGVRALEETGARCVVCIGGGDCCRAEQLRAPAASEWVVVDVAREGADVGEPEQRTSIPRPEWEARFPGHEPDVVFRVRGGD